MTDEERARAIAEPLMLAVVNAWQRQVGIDRIITTRLTKKIADTVATRVFEEHLAPVLAAVRAEEREACARVAESRAEREANIEKHDEEADDMSISDGRMIARAMRDIAAAIRARGE